MTTPDVDARDQPEPITSARVARFQPPSAQAEAEQRSHRMLLLVVRLLFFVLLVTVTMLTIASEASAPEEFEFKTAFAIFVGATALGLIVVLTDVMTPDKRLSSVVAVYVGVLIALMGALAVGALIDVVAEAWEIDRDRMGTYVNLAKVVIAIILAYLAVSVVLTTKDDFRLVIPYVEFSKQVRGIRPMVLDTSVLIDGRIDQLGETGFIDAPLIVPQFVIDELQTLADSGDKLKRERGRRGLNMVSRLQASPHLDVSIDETQVDGRSVDHMLLEFAESQNLRIVTTDYNLNKVAQIRGVPVLNINDLANTLKAQLLPGESMRVEIVRAGESPGQGVGYLADGTMVVVEGAGDHLGEAVQAIVTNSLQTSAGRMIFARVEGMEPASEGGAPGESTAEHIARAATTQPRTTGRPERAPITTSRRNPRR